MSTIASPINAALNELRFLIPLPILEKVFIKRSQRWREKHVSLNERIMEEVVRPRVLQDCNIAYGQTAFVDLSQCPVEYPTPYTQVYRIPKTLTHGRSILSALNVSFGVPSVGGQTGVYSPASGSSLVTAGTALMNASANMPVTSTANVVLIGENIVMVRDTLAMGGNAYLRCILENDEQMSHLHYKVIPVLKELVGYAVKSYIYVNYVLEMDQAELTGGLELGEFKNIVNEYRDAEELYQTTLREKYARAAVSTDHEQMRRFVKLQIGGYR